MRSPFILCAPGLKAGTKVECLTEHVDVPSTVLELLGTTPDWGVHGQSMLSSMRGDSCKEAVFGDGGHEAQMWDRLRFKDSGTPGARPLDGKQLTYFEVPESMARAKMVRTERWKLVVRLTGGNELYDMSTDPRELVNLYDASRKDPALSAVVTDLQSRLLEWCLRTDTDRPYEQKVGA